MKMDLETDSLGQREVPFTAYYRIQTQCAIENYPISGYRAHRQLVRAMGMIKKASAIANRELKLIDENRANGNLMDPETIRTILDPQGMTSPAAPVTRMLRRSKGRARKS